MPYTIVFETRNTRDVSAADATTAYQALAIISALQRANEEIKFIRSPQEGDIGVEMLRAADVTAVKIPPTEISDKALSPPSQIG